MPEPRVGAGRCRSGEGVSHAADAVASDSLPSNTREHCAPDDPANRQEREGTAERQMRRARMQSRSGNTYRVYSRSSRGTLRGQSVLCSLIWPNANFPSHRAGSLSLRNVMVTPSRLSCFIAERAPVSHCKSRGNSGGFNTSDGHVLFPLRPLGRFRNWGEPIA
jgi:hypothetical protein